MCGIAGIVYADRARQCDPDRVIAMRDIASYRGPDDAGIHIDGPVGLGHRRLSIIDLGGGHQPMADTRGANWIVYNGEVYNYRALRAELLAKGYAFDTHSDTEVILQLYADRGEACVESLNGMFAFAIWDTRRRALFLARDRMGVKPLYYAETSEAFVFGSEIKSLLASKFIAAEARVEAFAEYMLFRQVAGCDTLFRGVKALPPGCTMTVQDGRATIARYWSPLPKAEPLEATYEEARESLAALLDESVAMRLVSDVPVGTFCSGGVDSSLVTALAAARKSEPVNTFSVGFDEGDFDESRFAEIVSKKYGTVHHQLRVSNAEFSELFPRMVWHNDEPLDFANSVHIFALSRLAKQFVTVVLTGEGSDELFAGYPRYRIPGVTAAYRRIPSFLRRVASLLPDHRLRKLERYATVSPRDVMLYNSSYLGPDVTGRLAPGFVPFDGGARAQALEATAALGLDEVGRLSLLDQQTFLVSILHRQDKMSMAASIESRVPFMDYRLVELANRLPTRVKMRGGSGKALVKDIARRFLPSEVVDRRKSGFGVPLKSWFSSADGLGARIATLPDSPGADMFDRRVLKQTVEEHRRGSHDHSELLWTALNLATWRDTFRC
jgi:asparagine synthase (glutamine-hydrolysing)